MFEQEHGHHMYCMMNSGKPLTKMLADALLFNAYDMYHEGRRVQRIKARRYDGVIESNLEVCWFAESPVVMFEANVSTSMWENNTVQFVVKIEDLEGLEEGEWMQLVTRVMGMSMSFDDLPPEMQEHIREENGGEEPEGQGTMYRFETVAEPMAEE